MCPFRHISFYQMKYILNILFVLKNEIYRKGQLFRVHSDKAICENLLHAGDFVKKL